jgi:hypothetical protein
MYTASEASSDGTGDVPDGPPAVLDADEAAALEKRHSVLRQLEAVESELKELWRISEALK